jgi:hypothetical protein
MIWYIGLTLVRKVRVMKVSSLIPAALVLSMFLSCSQQDETSGAPVREMVLTVVDSLGVAYGDTTEMYGYVSGAVYTSPGRLVVLDKAMEVVRSYSDQEGLVASCYYHGSGPAEIMYGGFLARSGDGVALVDEWIPELLLVDSEMNPVSKIVLDETMSLFEPIVLADTSIVGCIYSSRQHDDIADFGVEVCR